MALVEMNGIGVVAAEFSLPRLRAWHVDATVNTADASLVTGAVTITILDGQLTMRGRGKVVGDYLDTVRVRVVAGAGGLAREAAPRYYQQTTLRIVVGDLLRAAGETLAASSDQTILNTLLGAWTVKGGTVADALELLLSPLGASWRMLADGSFWCGRETWPDAGVEVTVERRDSARHQLQLSMEAPLLLPGTTLNGEHVSYVEHNVTSDGVSSRVWLELDGADGDRASGPFIAMVRAAVPHIDYLALYRATVLAQSGNSVDVQPEDQRIPQMTSVPLRHGLPAVSLQVAPGSTVLIGWMNADPLKPYAALWDGSETLLSLSLGADADNVITKADLTALIAAIVAMATTGNSGGPLTFTAPAQFGSATVKVQR